MSRGPAAVLLAASVVGLLGTQGLGRAAAGGVDGGTPTTQEPPTTAPRPTVVPTIPRTLPSVPIPPPTASPPRTSPPLTTAPVTSLETEDQVDDDSGISPALIALIAGILVALALIVAVIVLLSRRRARDTWASQVRAATSDGRRLASSVVHGLGTLQHPDAAAHTWSDVEAEGADLHRRLQALAQGAPDQRSAEAVARADEALQELRAAVESDRGLRIGPPAPTAEQLGYSEAVLRQRTIEFEHAVEDLDNVVRVAR